MRLALTPDVTRRLDHGTGEAHAPSVAGRLADRTALITGGGSDIGRSIMSKMPSPGARFGTPEEVAFTGEILHPAGGVFVG